MKLQYPVSIGILVATFGTMGCQVSDSEIADRSWSPDTDNADNVDGGAHAGSGDQPMAGESGEATAGTYAAAGSGGTGSDDPNAYQGGPDAGMEDNGGTGGASTPVGGSGGSGGSTAPEAGSGGAGGDPAGAAGSGGAAGSDAQVCPSEYTMATHIVINVSWEGTLALSSGSGQVHVWTKTRFVEDGDTATTDSQSCGSSLPSITTSAVAGNEKILPEIPDATWEVADMPHFYGTATRDGDNVTADPGVALIGLTMSDPSGAWPSADGITGVDHDDDGKLGITAIPKTDAGYSAPPTDLFKTHRADKLYLAIRNIMTLSASVSGCPDTYSGTANVSKFENHIIGCHVKGGSECSSSQRQFVDDNRTVYVLGSATFTSHRVDDSATCADVRAAVPD